MSKEVFPNQNFPSLPDESGINEFADTLKELAENQKREHEQKIFELELNKIDIEHSFEFSKASLDAQIKDREASRKASTSLLKFFAIIFIIIFLMFGILILWLAQIGKEQIVYEILKIGGAFLAGLVGGGGGMYGYSSRRRIESQNNA